MDKTTEESLRAALLDVLVSMGSVLLTTPSSHAEAARALMA